MGRHASLSLRGTLAPGPGEGAFVVSRSIEVAQGSGAALDEVVGPRLEKGLRREPGSSARMSRIQAEGMRTGWPGWPPSAANTALGPPSASSLPAGTEEEWQSANLPKEAGSMKGMSALRQKKKGLLTRGSAAWMEPSIPRSQPGFSAMTTPCLPRKSAASSSPL